MFFSLIIGVMILSQVLDWPDVSVTETIIEPAPVTVQESFYEDTGQPQLQVAEDQG